MGANRESRKSHCVGCYVLCTLHARFAGDFVCLGVCVRWSQKIVQTTLRTKAIYDYRGDLCELVEKCDGPVRRIVEVFVNPDVVEFEVRRSTWEKAEPGDKVELKFTRERLTGKIDALTLWTFK